MVSRDCTDQQERQEKLYTALQLCKDAAPDLPLGNICQQVIKFSYFIIIVQVAYKTNIIISVLFIFSSH